MHSNATPGLHELIVEEIKASGDMPFNRFMQLALYHPEYGYYASGTKRVGKSADFITSVSIGSIFGTILAHRLHQYWQQSGQWKSFSIIEPAAHDGTLAFDILTTARTLDEAFFKAIDYQLVEPNKRLQQEQVEKLSAEFDGKFSQFTELSEISNQQGAIISNELVDAFPVHLFQRSEADDDQPWLERFVTLDENDQLIWQTAPTSNAQLRQLFDQLAPHAHAYPAGYQGEFNTAIESFAKQASQALSRGIFITIDYGHLQEELYHPARVEGTLQTYSKHQKDDNPLVDVGNRDITCHIDFTRLQRASEAYGFSKMKHNTQGNYLTTNGAPWLISLEKNPPADLPHLIKQFQTLTHPAMLGTKFQVLEGEK
ncbi:class I SAM-dependent methyltransferase [Persicirhabdus sediminis]|uniref:SAM-dependent methyltransferase n=1 Tax=Persicirhabdus sediminis TaxID=454144 RepID=A0A8J7SIQ1_9BACT|nr:SAM-dependent methyltransferase [Persicirhabdus sediminis]MBK1791610.1 SAM-dependent methyltransferase [Persicirhabdus sediminis]